MSRSSVYCLYTGGTIGCAGSPLAPLKVDKFAELVASQAGFTHTAVESNTLTLDVNVNDETHATIDVIVDAMEPAIDSSSMDPDDWVHIAQRILDNYDGATGIVVLHGTDTMAFSSSAISYLLGEGVSKPVIFTGSQIPLSKTRNDAQRNLITSITIAATQTYINEVCLYFDNKLLRGNRAVKISASAFHAFESPNFPELGRVGIDMKINKAMLLPPPPKDKTLSHKLNLDEQKHHIAGLVAKCKNDFSVVSIMLYPGIVTSTVKSLIAGTKPPAKGVILQAFGAGNAPANADMIQTLKDAHDNGIVLCDITQIVSGGVDLDAYASAAGLKHAGAISGYDLTPESSLTKMIYLLGTGMSQEEVETAMMTPFQGDLTHQVKEDSDSKLKAMIDKHGPPSKIQRLLKKRKL